MRVDRRRYFRVPVALDVSVRQSGKEEIQCKAINISWEGMGVNAPSPLVVGEVLDVVCAVPTPGPLVVTQATVIWYDKHGKAGFHLHFPNPVIRERISEWLDSEFHSY
jgi:PilZ domain